MLFGSYSQAFRAPTMGEMYNDSKHFSIPMGPTTLTNYWVPNPNLKPETNETQEYGFGLRFDDLMLADDSLQFKASYFDTKAKDYITPDYTMEIGRGPRGPYCISCTTFSTNVDRAKIWGWDTALSYKTPWFGWDLAYNRTRGKMKRPVNGWPTSTRIPSPARWTCHWAQPVCPSAGSPPSPSAPSECPPPTRNKADTASTTSI